jgi:uncharacterized protein (DUF2147 family)
MRQGWRSTAGAENSRFAKIPAMFRPLIVPSTAARPTTVSREERNRPLVGVPIPTGLRPQGANKWSGGQIYNPEDGKTYDANVSLEGANILKVQGCMLIECRTKTWTRQ